MPFLFRENIKFDIIDTIDVRRVNNRWRAVKKRTYYNVEETPSALRPRDLSSHKHALIIYERANARGTIDFTEAN